MEAIAVLPLIRTDRRVTSRSVGFAGSIIHHFFILFWLSKFLPPATMPPDSIGEIWDSGGLWCVEAKGRAFGIIDQIQAHERSLKTVWTPSSVTRCSDAQ